MTEVQDDFDGTTNEYPKIRIEDDSYNLKIIGIKEFLGKKYQSTEPETKLAIELEIEAQEGIPTVLVGSKLTHYIKPVISKAKKEGFSNSKLYDLLFDLNLLNEYRGLRDSIVHSGKKVSTEELCIFLNSNLVNKRLRCSTKTSNKGTDKAYSFVSKILRFI